MSTLMFRDLKDLLGGSRASILVPATPCVSVQVHNAPGSGASLTRELGQVATQQIVLENAWKSRALPARGQAGKAGKRIGTLDRSGSMPAALVVAKI
jgi:hypothetical protein